MKTALITGISGQDGAYLAKFLLEKGYKVIGGDRRTASGSLWRLEKLGILKDVEITDFELSEFTNIYRTFDKYNFDEVYNLAAQSFVKASFEMPTMTADVTGLGVCRILEAIRSVNPSIKFYQASSSEMFGKVKESPQNENTPFHPRSPYGVSKVFGHWITINYSESYDMFCSSGILFNHESPMRGAEFVTKKIAKGVANIKNGNQDYIELGRLDSQRDWGFAGDYVKAMYLMLQHKYPDSYVISTGKSNSVREFAEKCFDYIDISIKWKGKGIDEIGFDQNGKVRIIIKKKYFRPAEVDFLIGDSSKAHRELNWYPEHSFLQLIEIMMESELKGN